MFEYELPLIDTWIQKERLVNMLTSAYAARAEGNRTVFQFTVACIEVAIELNPSLSVVN